jgi:hypothetical protein
MTIQLTAPQARRLRMRGQALIATQPGGPTAAEEAARRACGLQSQDIFAASLGVRARSRGATLDDVERSRFDTRRVVWTWAMRGTLHLVATDDLEWLLPAVGPAMVAATRGRRAELGLDEEAYARGLRVVFDHLAAHGPATRAALGGALTSVGLPAGYSVEHYLLHRAALEGIVCGGPDRGATPTFVLLEDWLGGPLKRATEEMALAELVARYLAAYAPAALADLAAWSGLPMSLLRPAWEVVAGRLVEVEVAGRRAWLPRERLAELDAPPAPGAEVVLLPPFDGYLLGHKDRDLVLAPGLGDRVKAGGIIRATILLDGAVAGTWQPNRKGRCVNVTIEPFDALSPEVQAGIAAEITDIERFLGGI